MARRYKNKKKRSNKKCPNCGGHTKLICRNKDAPFPFPCEKDAWIARCIICGETLITEACD